jgi:hypothetical protein
LMTTAPGEVPAPASTAATIAIRIIAAGPERARKPQRFSVAFIVAINTSHRLIIDPAGCYYTPVGPGLSCQLK